VIRLNKILLFSMILFLCLDIDTAMAKENEIQEYKANDYTLSIGYEKLENDCNLIISIKSKLQDSLSIYQSDLPWGSRYSMIIIVAKLDASGTVLDQSLYIDDPSPNVVTMKYGESLTGKISLKTRFHDILTVLKTKQVIIFWSYQLKSLNNKSTERLGGWLIIPKKGQNIRR